MKKLIFALLFFSLTAHAQDSWRCTNDSSEVVGDKFYSCGIAEDRWEGRAREKALFRAEKEFLSICKLSTNCSSRTHGVDPGRTSCDKQAQGYKCYRLLIFSLGELKM